jgi:hypothetical protein
MTAWVILSSGIFRRCHLGSRVYPGRLVQIWAAALDLSWEAICFGNGHLPAKDLLCNGMGPFGNMKRRNPRSSPGGQHLVSSRRVSVFDLKRDEETGIGINRQ